MKKRIISLILIFMFIFSVPASAYQITGVDLHCDTAMLISLDTGDVLYSKNADQKVYPASITNLMTALVVLENVAEYETETLTYTKTANYQILGTGAVVLGLQVGETITVKDALASVLVSACGDSAYALAEHVGGSTEGFCELMNKKADELGMKNSNFTNPIGLHDANLYSTAEDIYILAKAAFSDEFIKKCLSSTSYTLGATNMRDEKTIVTSNLMINPSTSVYYKYAVCGKTGFTDEAGRCVVSTASYGGYNYMAIVLGAKTTGGVRYEFIDSAEMYRWAFNNFEYKSVLASNTPVTEAKVELSTEADFVTVSLEGGLEALLPKDADSSTIKVEPHLDRESYDAPIKKGQVMGTADIYYAEEKIGSVKLIATSDVNSSWFLVVARALNNFFTSPFMIILYVAVGIAAVVFTVIVVRLNHSKKRHRKVKYIPMNKKDFDE